MLIKGWIIVLAVIGGIAWWMYASHEEANRVATHVAQERKNLEVSRVSTTDPLINLAGCMANHLTTLSALTMGQVIYYTDTNKILSAEELETFEQVRNALMQECMPIFGQGVRDKYGVLTYPQLHTAMFQVMRTDESVKKFIGIHRTTNDAITSLYVKK